MAGDGLTVVAGSLGDQGGAVAKVMHAHALPVRALSHNLQSPAATFLLGAGVDVLQDDLDVPEVVLRDLAGARNVFGALTPFDKGGLETELRQARNLAWAAVQTGVERFVYSAVGDPEQDRDVSPHARWGVERLIESLDLPLTLLRPAFFMENLDEYALRRSEEGTLVLRMPLPPDTLVQWIAVHDVGEFVRLAFERPQAVGDGPLELAGDELTLQDALAMVGEKLGAPTRVEQISLDDVTDRHAHGMYRWFQSYAKYDADMERLRALWPSLRTFRDWLDQGWLDESKLEEKPAA